MGKNQRGEALAAWEKEKEPMGIGMGRDVERAIGALSTLVVGVGILMLRELFRRDSEDSRDLYYQKKYGQTKLPLFQHAGSCDCGSLRFSILAPKRVEAFDDSNTLSCKKGRFPFLVIPTSCFEMLESTEISIYESPSTCTQHVFCSKCGIHIFQFDHTQTDWVAVNVYCVEDENFDDLKIIFIPKGARPLSGAATKRLPVNPTPRRRMTHHPFNAVEANPEDAQASFQKQLLLWARLDSHQSNVQPSDDTQSTTSSTSQSGRFTFSMEDTMSVMNMKDQLEYYLKRHLDANNTTPEDEDHQFQV